MPPLRRVSDIIQTPRWEEPWPGLASQKPEGASSLPINAFSDSLNFILRGGRIESRPKLTALATPPDGYPIKGLVTFTDVYNNQHSIVLTPKTAYAMTTGWVYNALTGDLKALSNAPYSLVRSLRKLYFCNGGQEISYLDGSNTVHSTTAGIAAYFLATLANHLIAANITYPLPGVNGSSQFPYRVQWSASGNPGDWSSYTSGLSDLVEVPDNITGLVALGQNAYIFRSNGITVMEPTGQGILPFAFYQLSNAPKGLGTIYPYSVDVFGGMCAFIGNDDIYLFDGVNFTRIGGLALRQLFNDFYASTSDYILGRIIPGLGQGYVISFYILTIPGVNVIWIYNLNEGNWVRIRTSNNTYPTALESVATS